MVLAVRLKLNRQAMGSRVRGNDTIWIWDAVSSLDPLEPDVAIQGAILVPLGVYLHMQI
jgi:hypothetical protein